MNKIFLLLGAGLLAGCAAVPPRLVAVGARDAAGARTGSYRVVNGADGPAVAQGHFTHGKMDGEWTFFDSHHVRVAELTYHDGAASGPYQTYFGSVLDPPTAGKLESEGQMQNGAVVGRHRGYDASGKVFTDAVLTAAGRVGRVLVGTRAQAETTSASDEQFAKAEEGLIRPALP